MIGGPPYNQINTEKIPDTREVLSRLIDSGDSVDKARLQDALKIGKTITPEDYIELSDKLLAKYEEIIDGLAAGGMKVGEEVRRLENDAVTGLLKHELLEQRLGQLIKELNPPSSIERREPYLHAVVVLFMDLDNLKAWNSISRAMGDRALQTLTSSVQSVVHDSGVMFRRGDQSDEVLAILRIDKEVTNDALEEGPILRVQNAANSAALEVDGKKLPVTASVGHIILRPGEKRSVNEILRDVEEREQLNKQQSGIKEERIKRAQANIEKSG